MRAWIAGLVVLLVACEKGPSTREVAACADGLDRAMVVDREQRLDVVARACGGPAAGSQWERAKATGDAVARARRGASGDVARRMDVVIGHLEFPLSLSATSKDWRLPASARTVPPEARVYVVVGAGELRVGPLEMVLLGAGGVVRQPRRDEQVVTLDALRLALADYQRDAGGPAAPAKLRVEEVEEKEDVLERDEAGGTGTKMIEAEGKMGKKDSSRTTGQYVMKNMGADPQLARAQAMERAHTAGILGALVAATPTADPAWPLAIADAALPATRLLDVAKAAGGAWIAVATPGADVVHAHAVAVAGTGVAELRVRVGKERLPIPDAPAGGGAALVLDAAPDATCADLVATLDAAAERGWKVVLAQGEPDALGGLLGIGSGEPDGTWGYGSGGGGPGMGTIGSGYGTIGHGSGTGVGGRRANAPKVNIGSPSATGDLDKNVIRRYIRQKLPQIEYCYQKQLVVKPSLEGTIRTQFTIDGNGAVIQVNAQGIDPDVSTCVAGVIKSIQFPKPKGGGVVNVSYPFTFRPAGE